MYNKSLLVSLGEATEGPEISRRPASVLAVARLLARAPALCLLLLLELDRLRVHHVLLFAPQLGRDFVAAALAVLFLGEGKGERGGEKWW